MMTTTNYFSYSCIAIFVLLCIGCLPEKRLKQERFVLPGDCKGYYAVVYSDNFNPIDDTSEIREFRFDTTRFVLTKLKFNSSRNELYLRKKDNGFDTLRERLYPSDPLTAKTIYTSRVETHGEVNETKEIITYVFYVGVPSADPGKEEFFFSRSLDSIVNVNFFHAIAR
jgi:hypothetical protein